MGERAGEMALNVKGVADDALGGVTEGWKSIKSGFSGLWRK
tara:strand:+ start:272 stop:394 length:123 start_codon:yes stop_codon:yes gene_type:complete